jgi:hypothetical protein
VSTWILVWFIVALVTTTALLAFTIALVRHLLLIGRTARQLQDEAQPILTELSSEGDRASRHVAALQRPTWGRGAASGTPPEHG